MIPDYRLYPEVRFPTFLRDSAQAVAWVSRHLANESAPASKVVLVGHSAGAHIAALLALDERYLGESGLSTNEIGAVIGLAGPYAFDPLGYRSTKPIFQTAENPSLVRPVTFARPGAPPMLLLHGEDDRTVLPRNSEELARLLSEKGSSATYQTLEGIGHIEILLALAAPFQHLAPVADLTIAFIDEQTDRRLARRASHHRYP